MLRLICMKLATCGPWHIFSFFLGGGEEIIANSDRGGLTNAEKKWKTDAWESLKVWLQVSLYYELHISAEINRG